MMAKPLSAAAIQSIEIVDPQNEPTRLADWIVTGGAFEGVVNLTLGTLDHAFARSSDDHPRVVVCARLRMPQPFAERLYRSLGAILGKPTEPPPEPVEKMPPKNALIH